MATATQPEIALKPVSPSPLAPAVSRVISTVIDFAIVAITSGIFVSNFVWPSAYLLVSVSVWLLYAATFEGSRIRATPGKLLFRLRVASATGGAISFRRALARNVAKLVTGTLSLFFRLFIGHRTFHESLSGTVVLRKRFQSLFQGESPAYSPSSQRAGWAIVGVIFALLVLRGLMVTSTQSLMVEGYSMAPAYTTGDHVWALRVSYLFSSPQRGDVIAFRAVSAGFPDKMFVYRIVGIPGDQVEVANGTVYVNSRPVAAPEGSSPPSYAWGPEVVPADDYFVLGDNRANSFDSHAWPKSPWVARNDIIGKVY